MRWGLVVCCLLGGCAFIDAATGGGDDDDDDGGADVVDAATTNDDGGTATVCLGPTCYDTSLWSDSPFAPKLLAAGEFGGDSAPDLVVADGTTFVSFLINDGSGLSFSQVGGFSADEAVSGLAVGHFGASSATDLAVVQRLAEQVLVWLDDGTFNYVDLAKSGKPRDLVVADFDKDGLDDIAVSLDSVEQLVILLAKDDFAELLPRIGLREPAGGLAVGDFDGDQNMDIAAAVGGGSLQTYELVFGDGKGSFVTKHTIFTDAVSVDLLAAAPMVPGGGDEILGSFKCDGTCAAADLIRVHDSGGAFVGGYFHPDSLDVNAMITGDFNSDTAADVVIAGQTVIPGPEIMFLFGANEFGVELQGGFSYVAGIDRGDVEVNSLAAADFNGDSVVDIAAGIVALKQVRFLLSSPR